MLNLVGTGISTKGIAIEAVEASKLSSKVYIDRYTSAISEEKLEFLEKEIGKKIKELSRSDMEENIGKLMEEAKKSDITILVGGDPLMATTHKIMFIKAKELRVKVKVYHSSSIITAIMGQSGLDFYRFGAIATIPRWSEHYTPVSFYDTIEKNQSNNLHTILLLDYDQKKGASIGMGEAIKILKAAETQKKKGIINSRKKILVIANMSQHGEERYFININDAESLSTEELQAVIIIPAELTEIENEVMASIYG